ncbi:MAG: hypothetical protein KDD34_07435 [Bdellovibrionales bacterium]|nr:hypothetical protein [Bdellovibrionales bacterium]
MKALKNKAFFIFTTLCFFISFSGSTFAIEQWDTLQLPPGASNSCEALLDTRGEKYLDAWKKTEEALRQRGERGESQPSLKVFFPSMTFPYHVIGKIKAIDAYELRGVGIEVMNLAKSPAAQLLIVTSVPLEMASVRNYLKQYLMDDEKIESAMQRIHFFNMNDASSLPLAQKILEPKNKSQLLRLRELIDRLTNHRQYPVFMKTFITTPLEGVLADQLDISIFGNPKVNAFVEVKSNFHRIAEESGVQKTTAYTDISSEKELVLALKKLAQQSVKKVMLKKNQGTSGQGNATLEISKTLKKELLSKKLNIQKIMEDIYKIVKPVNKDLNAENFIEEMFAHGGVAEAFIENIVITEDGNPWSPSGQFDVYSDHIQVMGCHDQKFIPGTEGVFEGAIYPAMSKAICQQIYKMGLKMGEKLRRQGYRGRFAMDTIVSRDPKTQKETVWLIEINARSGGTHTVDAMVQLTDAVQNSSGRKKGSMESYRWYAMNNEGRLIPLFYEGTDNFYHEGLKSFSSDQELLDFIYQTDFSKYLPSYVGNIPMANRKNKRGILPHMIQARSQGKMGFMAIGHQNLEDARSIFADFKEAFSRALDDRLQAHLPYVPAVSE